MIPKRAHFYWHGDEPLTPLREMSVQSFRILNPDWEVSVHHAGKSSDHMVEKITRSDAARYGVLHRAGGIYFDTDIVFVKPIPEDWLGYDLLVPCDNFGQIYGVHVLGSKEGSEFFKFAMRLVAERMNGNRTLGCQSLGTKLWIGRDALELAASYNESLRPVPIYEFLTTGPNDIEELWSPPGQEFKRAIGVHWYGGDHLSKRYEYLDYDSLPECDVKLALSVTHGSQ